MNRANRDTLLTERLPIRPLERLPLRLGLQTKIILWAFVPTSIIMMLVALVTFLAYQRVTERLILERDQEVTRLAANQIGAILREYANQLEDEARNDNLYLDDYALRQAALERSRKRLFLFDGGVLLLDSQGLIINTTEEQLSRLGDDWSQDELFLSLADRPVISDRILQETATQGLLAVSVPITGQDRELLGALVGLIRVGETSVSTFYGDIVRLRLNKGRDAYLIDEAGQIIYHSDPQENQSVRLASDASSFSEPTIHYSEVSNIEVRNSASTLSSGNELGQTTRAAQLNVPSQVRDSLVIQRYEEERTGAFRTFDQNGTAIVAAFAPVPGTAWGLISETKWWLLLSDSQEFQPYLLALLLLGITAPALFVAVGVRRIIHPINRLIEATQTIATGDFSQTIQTRSGDEIEILSEQFNYMSSELHTSYTLLEKRVAERTRELTALNEMAKAVNRSLDLDETLQQAVIQTCQTLETDTGGVYLFDSAQNQLILSAHQGVPKSLIPHIKMLALGEGYNGFVAESGCPLAVDDVASDPRRSPQMQFDTGISSLVSVPLWDKHRVVGTLFAAEFHPRTFSDRDISMLTAIGHHVATAIEHARLYQQAQQLAVLEERSRLARNLHDSVTQSLYSLTLLAEGWRRISLTNQLTNPVEALTELGDLGKQALREMRLLVYELRPPDLEQEGLLGALHKRLGAVEKRCGIDARLVADDIVELPAQVEEALYWIAQEALSNALKHAGANHVWIRIFVTERTGLDAIPDLPSLSIEPSHMPVPVVASTTVAEYQSLSPVDHDALRTNGNVATAAEPHLIFEVQDDGAGFLADSLADSSYVSGGLGLTTMRERAEEVGGQFSIQSKLKHGTTIRVALPWAKVQDRP
ncbi:MAG: GAF domain-containing protein [Chloroflexota bacterium]